MRNFRKYDIWIDGIEFVLDVYTATDTFPSEERFGLTSQARRSAVSIPSNIAEGSSRKSDIEFSRFLEIALGSAFELETQLILAFRRKYLSQVNFDRLLEAIHSLQRRINALRTTIDH